MAITITLTADAEASTGIDFEAYVASYFSDFQFSGWPYILGGDGPYAGDEIVILDKLEKKPATTKVVVLDGEDFFYYFTGHTVSGSLASVRLATLGDSYEKDGSFDQNKSGHIKDISTSVEITGLSISNAEGVKGDFHNLVADLMATDAGHADASILIAALANDAQILNGSGKADTYTGTKFADVIRGNAGSDTLGGAGGNDNIDGGSGDDTAVFRGALADYTVTANGDGSVTIADKRTGAPDGTDTLRHVEHARFSDGSIDLPTAADPPIEGTAKKDKLKGTADDDTMLGFAGKDSLDGRGGNDSLAGGGGADQLTGGSGADTFVFGALADSTKKPAGQDLISDFDRAEHDRIDLSGLGSGLSFIGKDAFDGGAGEVRYAKKSGDTYVYADTDGDKKVDFAIHLDGNIKLAAGDFIL